ncbi:MAG: PD-(D/E)XK nuclease-like domain-containing protein [Clostridia bacterium]|nr:PD-(D/E)XK nuclease-like domain-containing protein [Clostridia bacterium]
MNLEDIFEDIDITANTFFNKYLPERRNEPMTEQEYNEIDAIRRSDLLKLRKSALHYLWAKHHPEEANEPTPSKIFGAAAHKYVLETRDFFNEYAVAPIVDKRTKAGKEEWEQFRIENEGKTVISQDDLDVIRDMVDAICEHPTAKEYLTGIIETPIFWTDDETGVKCKIRPDCVAMIDGRPIIVDYKTTTSCDERAFASECRKFGYKIQAGMYTEGWAMTNFSEVGFAFVAQEKTAPYAVRVFQCDPEFISQGNRQFHELLRYYKQCSDEGFWPGYSDGYLMSDPWEDPQEDLE